MYCPNCGAESTFGLNYCKHCGGNLGEGTAQVPTTTPARNIFAALILAAATTGIVLGGLAIVFSFALGLIGPQPPGYAAPVHDAIVVAGMMVIFGSAAIILATFLLIKLFARVMGFNSVAEKQSARAKALPVAQRVPQISAPPASMHSVTEHTTRNFEPRVYQRDTSE
ncbi:MAG TPA: hypothetical protein VFB82_05025, partial [Blastocatellia bacterium]|nr:hypothetical protein [Blastocatellia bacterium]